MKTEDRKVETVLIEPASDAPMMQHHVGTPALARLSQESANQPLA